MRWPPKCDEALPTSRSRPARARSWTSSSTRHKASPGVTPREEVSTSRRFTLFTLRRERHAHYSKSTWSADDDMLRIHEKIEPGIECRHSTAGHTPSRVNEIRNPLRPSPGRLYPRRISCAQSALRNEVCVPSRCAAYRTDSRGDPFEKKSSDQRITIGLCDRLPKAAEDYLLEGGFLGEVPRS